MASFVVESYASEIGVDFQREQAQRAAELSTGVRYIRTTFLTADETALHLFEATSAEALRQAAQVAALQYDRIVEVVEATAGGVDRNRGHER